ncbi:cytochrome b [Octadecabacter ascidiaceicola]|uniref:Cytochrome b562 n=1 Tax=Octadecabacter ascidiaceicola TaxID=1655543 RepID=A0A238K3H8_9RHOB|nr:cytochrome b/b6 domain-containing protein [Octadecabacter ascidiaceicola]SMX37303.1 Cytochrome b562 [Octadecabacter ascidiaceicola]
MTTRTGYSRTQIVLHWLTAIAVLVAWFTHEGMEEVAKAAWRANEGPFPTIHTIAGALAMIMIIVRIVLRHRRGAPEPEGTEMGKLAATWGHRLIYALVIIVPLLGAATWFGGFRNLSGFHEFTAKALMLAALGHAAMAIWHQFGKKDGTLMRMLRPE